MFKPGDLIWVIEKDEYGDVAEVSVFLFMAKCSNYIICCSKYNSCESFEEQLEEMANESEEYQGIDVYMFKKEYCFKTQDEAYEHFGDLK